MSRPSPHSGPIRRRTFLIGAAATGLLSACGSDGDGVAPQDDADENTGAGVLPAQGEGDGSVAPEFAGDSADLDEGTFSIIQRYPSNVAGPGEIRLPFSLSNAEAQFVTDGPLSLGAQIVDLDGNEVSLEADELLARLIQHELDHLDGILLIDHLEADDRRGALRILRERYVDPGLPGSGVNGRSGSTGGSSNGLRLP